MLERLNPCYLRPATCGVLLATVIACLAGCAEEPAIREYTVAKRKNTAAVEATGPAVEQQILGVIVPRGESAWYFKMMDEPQKLAKYEADFRTIVENVRFEASGEPQFQLAEGWSKEDVRSVVFARLKHEKDGVTATVTQLPAPTEDEASWRNSVFDNVNRWRNQLSLSPVDWERMEPELEEMPELTQGSAKAYFVSLVGKKAPGGGGMGSAPFMNQSAPFMNQSAASPADSTTPPTPAASGAGAVTQPGPTLSYSVPDGWSEQAATGIRRAIFSIDDGQGEPLSVIVSTASVKSAAMIDMWIEQLGMEVTEEVKQKVAEQTKSVQVNAVDSNIYELNGTEGESILVAQIPWTESESLFVKLTGKTERVAAQRDAFMQLVNSLKW